MSKIIFEICDSVLYGFQFFILKEDIITMNINELIEYITTTAKHELIIFSTEYNLTVIKEHVLTLTFCVHGVNKEQILNAKESIFICTHCHTKS